MYKEIVVITKSVASDAVADIMWELGANGVKVMDPKDLDFVLHSDTCWDYVDDNLLNLPDDVKVSFFVEEEEVLTKLEHLKSALVELENKYGKMDIAVEITIPGQETTEVIINRHENLDNKLEFYKNCPVFITRTISHLYYSITFLILQ